MKWIFLCLRVMILWLVLFFGVCIIWFGIWIIKIGVGRRFNSFGGIGRILCGMGMIGCGFNSNEFSCFINS